MAFSRNLRGNFEDRPSTALAWDSRWIDAGIRRLDEPKRTFMPILPQLRPFLSRKNPISDVPISRIIAAERDNPLDNRCRQVLDTESNFRCRVHFNYE
jgi:hypothetical protein